jgi:hypothetical protein
MADNGNGNRRSRPTATRPRGAGRVTARPSGAGTRAVGLTTPRTTLLPVAPRPLGAGLPTGLDTATLAADVSGQLRAVAPTFGQVLRSIGTGVAESQKALDDGVIDTVKDLAETDITVVTDVIQHLDDDGQPVPAQTQLVSTDLSVLNFFMPTIHEWKRVVISMDLSVGAFNESDGMTFHAKQTSIGVGTVGLFWGFIGIGETHDTEHTQDATRDHDQEASWSRGEVRLDAVLGPRRTDSFPSPTQVALGPQIIFSQGTVKETPVAGHGVNRTIDVQVTVLTHAGDENPNKPLTIEAGALAFSFSSTAPFTGSTTNADGKVLVTFKRNVPSAATGAGKFPVTVRLGSLAQAFTLTI